VLARLAVCSAPLRAALAGALRAPGQRLRWGAAYTLGRASLAGPEVWPAVREAMALDDGDQRWAAAELGCALVRRHPALGAELRAALGTESATLRKMALYCLRDLAADDAPALARAALADPDAGVRLAAVATAAGTAPGSAHAGSCAAGLARAVAADPDPGVRRAAAAALGKLGVAADDVLRCLDEASQSPDQSLARAARSALRTLSGGG
jgi:HEAT repeat protein